MRQHPENERLQPVTCQGLSKGEQVSYKCMQLRWLCRKMETRMCPLPDLLTIDVLIENSAVPLFLSKITVFFFFCATPMSHILT